MLKRNDIEKLKTYAVFWENSARTTQLVGQKKPLFVDGKPIHDLNGNVSVWVKDWDRSQLAGGTDPQGPSTGSHRLMRGGSWGSGASLLGSAYRFVYNDPSERKRDAGFRLVRTAK